MYYPNLRTPQTADKTHAVILDCGKSDQIQTGLQGPQVIALAGGNSAAGSQDGPGDQVSFYNLTGITVDAAGNLYISDSKNQVIKKIIFH